MEPDEIESKEFVVRLRGYDPVEVRAFLTEVARRQREERHIDRPSQELGDTVAGVIQQALDAAQAIRQRAEVAAASIGAAAEEHAAGLSRHAQEVLDDAEQAALETRWAAQHEADALMASTRDGVEALRRAEGEVRSRLSSSIEWMQALVTELDNAPIAERAPDDGTFSAELDGHQDSAMASPSPLSTG